MIIPCFSAAQWFRWVVIVAGALALGAAFFFFPRRSNAYPIASAVNHKSGVAFNGLVYTNGGQYGSFSLTNGYSDPISFMLWNLESSRSTGWVSLHRTIFKPGAMPARGYSGAFGVQGLVNPGATVSFLVPQPNQRGNWRARVSVAIGRPGFQWQDRQFLLRNGRLRQALIPNSFESTNYFRFFSIGLVDSPIVTWLPNPTLQ